MAGSGVTLYAVSAAGNKTVIGAIDWREDIYMPNQINDNVAQIMADVRALANSIGTGWIEIGDTTGTYTATYVSATSFRFDGVDVTAYYRAGMRVRVVAPTPGTISGTITSSAFSTHTTLTVAWDSGALSNEAITSVSLGIGSGGGAGGQPSYRNIMGRNGGFEVWQRGAGGSASFAIAASGAQYTSDGWWFACGANQASTISQQAGLTSGSRYAAIIQRNAGQIGVAAMAFEYPLDSDEIALLRGNIATLSLTLVAGANWSPASGNIAITLYVGTGVPARRILGPYTGETTPIGVVQAITTTATRYTFTSAVAIPTTATQASLMLTWTPVGTAGAADAFAIDDVGLEAGSVATAFERRPLEQELAACRRHFQKTFAYETAPAQNVAGHSYTVTPVTAAGVSANYFPDIRFHTPMRSSPTITLYNPRATNAQARNLDAGADHSSTSLVSATASAFWIITNGAAGGLVSQPMAIHWAADAGI